MNKIKALAILGTAIIVIAVFAFLNPSITGLAGLGVQEKNSPAQTSRENSWLSANLSFKALQQTSLEVKALNSELQQCPQMLNASFSIKNSGKETAEAMIIKTSENLKVLDCVNCSTKSLKPGEEINIILKACKASVEKAFLKISAVNSGEKILEVK